MSIIYTNYSHLVIIGSQSSKAALSIYQKIAESLQAQTPFIFQKTLIITPQSHQELAKQTIHKAFILNLFLINGYEFQKLYSQCIELQNSFHTITPPLLENQEILDTIFQHEEPSCFILHGSSKYNNAEQYHSVIQYGHCKNHPYFCFLDGNLNYKTVLPEYAKLSHNINIIPLFALTGKHITEDIHPYLQNLLSTKTYSIKPALLERIDVTQTLIKSTLTKLIKQFDSDN